MTELQSRTLAAVLVATYRGEWFRARSSGERVTLASLHSRGACVRRVRRESARPENRAFEYQVSEKVLAVASELRLDKQVAKRAP